MTLYDCGVHDMAGQPVLLGLYGGYDMEARQLSNCPWPKP